jgi:predicted glutamine amidotransferase
LPSVTELTHTLRELIPRVAHFGTFNFLLSNGEALWAHCSTNLHWLVRQHPFTQATLKDCDWTVDFAAASSASTNMPARRSRSGRDFLKARSGW